MCEELGTGWDKIAITCELCCLPAPKIDLYSDSTKVSLFSEKAYSNISPEDKMWACYLHACIKHVQGEYLTNSSLRRRFGLKDSSSGSISRLIKDTVELGLGSCGGKNGNIVDKYRVFQEKGIFFKKKVFICELYIDAYSTKQPNLAPRGFTL